MSSGERRPVELAVRRFLDVRGRRRARRPQRALRHRLPRPRGRAPHGPARRLAGRRHRLARAASAGGRARSASDWPRSPTSSARRRGRATARLPDAEATAEILLALIGLAQERGAETVAQLVDLAAPRARRLAGKRSLVAGAPPRPGVYLFRDRNDQVLYVGRARDLRGRLRSYFRTERQRPAVEAALGALERVEWRVLGSELEAASRGAAPAAGAASARQRAQRAPRSLRLPPPPRRGLVRHRLARSVRTAQEPKARPGGGPRARRLGRRACGRAARSPEEAAASVRRPALRGRGAAA